MTEYGSVCTFGGVRFKIGDISVSYQPSTLKTNIGKSFVEKDIPLRNVKDTVLQISGIITGLSESPSISKATAIENDRASLIALDDGYYHTYSDEKHSFNAVISDLQWADNADRSSGQPYKFSLTLKQWQ